MTKEEKPRFSFSDIRTFQECPFRLKEKKAKRFIEEKTEALLIGSYAHAMLESAERANEFIEENAVSMIGNLGKKNEGIKKSFKDIALAVNEIKRTDIYQDLNEKNSFKELYLKAPYKDFEISGIVDVLKFDHENRIIEIIDWKTANNFEDIFDKNVRAYFDWWAHYREQLSLYAWLIAQNYDEYALAGYSIKGTIVGFTKKLPINIKIVEIDFGLLAEISDKFLVLNVLSELDNIAHAIDDDTKENYYCHNCACCIENKKFEKLEVVAW